MGLFVYVSHRDTVEALTSAKELMINGHFPFVPQLNRLISGRSDVEWENYFKMWLLRCDAILLTPSYRPHEKLWALEEKLPICNDIKGINDVNLPPFKQLGMEFGIKIAEFLPKDEAWRKKSKDEVVKDFENISEHERSPLNTALHALMAWDRMKNG